MKKDLKKISFTVRVPVDQDEDKGTKEVQLDVRVPTLKQQNEAQFEFNRKYHESLSSQAPLRIEIESMLKERKVQQKTKQGDLDTLNKKLNESINRLEAGGIFLSEGRKLALEIRKQRAEIASLNRDRQELDMKTAEAQAENARFNWYVANCTVYSDSGKLFFAPVKVQEGDTERVKDSVEVYLEQAVEEYAQECARQFGSLQYGLDADFEKKLPENDFLLKYKFIREKDLRLINSDGHLVDEDNKLINEEGFLVDKDGHRIDRLGISLDEDNKPIIERKPFFED